MPIQGMKVEVVIRNRKFYCQNAECGHKTFAESYESLPRMARRSRRLTQAIVHTAINTSSITASKMLGEGTADIGKSTICRLLKKSEQIEERIDKLAPKVVCIDDFATKKRHRYGTVMVDAQTGRIVDMLESRESTEVSKWLATYPNLKVVSRDGSQMYAKAIRTAHPDALQVSDRFHIFKGLTEAAKQFILSLIPQRTAVPSDTPASSYWQKQPKAGDLPWRLHDASTKRRTAAVEKVRELANQWLNMNQISEATGYCRSTVKKYLTPDFEPSYSAYGMNCPTHF